MNEDTVYCPKCSAAALAYKSRKIKVGEVLRYCRCPKCAFRFPAIVESKFKITICTSTGGKSAASKLSASKMTT